MKRRKRSGNFEGGRVPVPITRYHRAFPWMISTDVGFCTCPAGTSDKHHSAVLR